MDFFCRKNSKLWLRHALLLQAVMQNGWKLRKRDSLSLFLQLFPVGAFSVMLVLVRCLKYGILARKQMKITDFTGSVER